jgi:hypothetical protein
VSGRLRASRFGEEQADQAEMAEVREVYGENWPTPYLTMYEDERRRRDR